LEVAGSMERVLEINELSLGGLKSKNLNYIDGRYVFITYGAIPSWRN
jgi:hypothetical protein